MRNVLGYLCIVGCVLTVAACEKSDGNDTGTVVNQSCDGINGERKDITNNGRTYTVVKIWGTDQETGFAYGCLLAEEIVDVLQTALIDYQLADNLAISYDEAKEQLENHIIWPDEVHDEIEAMVTGIEAALPNESDRTFTADDSVLPDGELVLNVTLIEMYNALTELRTLNGQLHEECSSVSVWGEFTAAGGTFVASNHDWGKGEDPAKGTLIALAKKPDDGVGWLCTSPIGMMMCSRGLSEEGLAMGPHGAYPITEELPEQFYPVAFHTHQVMEGFQAGMDLPSFVEGIFQDYTRCLSNNFHYVQATWPEADGDEVGVVVETDGYEDYQDGATLRLPSDNLDHFDFPNTTDGYDYEEALVTTNHFLERCAGAPGVQDPCDGKLSDPGSRGRYDKAWQAIEGAYVTSTAIDLDNMKDVLKKQDLGVGTNVTTQSVVSELGQRSSSSGAPADLKIHVSFETDAQCSWDLPYVTFAWSDFFSDE
jgi:hypothetical protein